MTIVEALRRADGALSRRVGRALSREADSRRILVDSRTPENFEMPAFTVTIPADTSTVDALIVTFAAAVTVMPAEAISSEFPFESSTRTTPGPSLRVIFCPPGVSAMNFSCPVWSSRVTVTPFFERITLSRLPSEPICAGAVDEPFHSPPRTSG